MQATLTFIGAVSSVTYITQAFVEIWANGFRSWVQVSVKKAETETNKIERGVIEADHLI